MEILPVCCRAFLNTCFWTAYFCRILICSSSVKVVN
uniref:Uncharacterized protein n=1 Tax=Rhizophora mucronata TaxID=61149 RepID=A0A2P2QRK3_RHIMU